MRLILREKRHELGEIYSFVFQPTEAFSWIAGQYINLTMPDIPPSAADRLFTIASAPFEKYLLITTLLGTSPFKQRMKQLKLGEEIEADQLGGDFIWQDDGREKLYLAGGIGVTTYRPILLDRLHQNLPNQATLLYAGKEGRRPFVAELRSIANKDHSLVIKDYIDERLTVEVIFRDVPDASARTIYLSGSQLFAESLGEGLMQRGIPRPQIKYDWFDGYVDLEY